MAIEPALDCAERIVGTCEELIEGTSIVDDADEQIAELIRARDAEWQSLLDAEREKRKEAERIMKLLLDEMSLANYATVGESQWGEVQDRAHAYLAQADTQKEKSE